MDRKGRAQKQQRQKPSVQYVCNLFRTRTAIIILKTFNIKYLNEAIIYTGDGNAAFSISDLIIMQVIPGACPNIRIQMREK